MSSVSNKRRLALSASIIVITLLAFGITRAASSWLDGSVRPAQQQVLPTS